MAAIAGLRYYAFALHLGLGDVSLPVCKALCSGLDTLAVAEGTLLDPGVDCLVIGEVCLDLPACRGEVDDVGRG